MKQKRKAKKPSAAHLWLVPTKHNAHRPHLLRRHGLLAVALTLVGIQLFYNLVIIGKPKILGYATNVSAQAVRADINESRAANGLNTLTTDDQLNQAASLKANDMFQTGYWSHNAPDGTQPWKWFEVAGYKYQNAGENLAKDFQSAKGLTSAWLGSETHRKNMLNPAFQNMGVAVVNGTLNNSETTLVVALFGTRQTDPALPSTENGSVLGTNVNYNANLLANPAQIDALLNPISITTLLILLGVLAVALLTHWHYVKLPKKVRKSWYQHHALYTAGLTLMLIAYITYIFTAGNIL